MTVEDKADRFREDIADSSDRAKRAIGIFRQYNSTMTRAGSPSPMG